MPTAGPADYPSPGLPAGVAPMPEGIEVDSVTSWLLANGTGFSAPIDFELISGGRSNLTFSVTDAAGRRCVLRRPPVGPLLPSAHDVGREYRIISALVGTKVPVPATLAYCVDPSVTGAPFYVMELVKGHILRDRAAAETQLDVAQRHAAGESLADTLAALHAVDVDSVGLGNLARRDSYIPRQLKRWQAQVEAACQSEQTLSHLGLADVHDLLAASVPEQHDTTIVHGDYRLDNCVLGDDGTVEAVLDWELCTLGDPRADIGMLMVYWTDDDSETPALLVSASSAPGFPTRSELARRYSNSSGRDTSELPFFVAFGYWKLACILAGVYTRYRHGQAAGDRDSVDGYFDQIGRLSSLAIAAMDGHT